MRILGEVIISTIEGGEALFFIISSSQLPNEEKINSCGIIPNKVPKK